MRSALALLLLATVLFGCSATRETVAAKTARHGIDTTTYKR